jgi:hypothetical protein
LIRFLPVSRSPGAFALAVGFGLGFTAEQVGLLMAGVVAIGNLIKTIWARGQVTPVALPRDNEGRALVVRGVEAILTA